MKEITKKYLLFVPLLLIFCCCGAIVIAIMNFLLSLNIQNVVTLGIKSGFLAWLIILVDNIWKDSKQKA